MLTGLVVGWRVHTSVPEFLAGVGLLLLFALAANKTACVIVRAIRAIRAIRESR